MKKDLEAIKPLQSKINRMVVDAIDAIKEFDKGMTDVEIHELMPKIFTEASVISKIRARVNYETFGGKPPRNMRDATLEMVAALHVLLYRLYHAEVVSFDNLLSECLEEASEKEAVHKSEN